MEEPAVVFRSERFADSEERAFMFTAVGIANRIAWDGREHLLLVPGAEAERARANLARYEIERRAPPPALPARPPEFAGAPLGTMAYVLLLLGASYAISAGVGRLDAFWLGELSGRAVQQGEWWRAFTALTLHRDLPHLLGNLLFGSWIGYFTCRRFGPGLAWAIVVLAAAAANFLDARFGPPDYRSVGASTAVFAALGILAVAAWRDRARQPQRRLLRLSPLVAGVILLGWTGSEGEGTDLVAHALGFLFGTLAGAFVTASTVWRRIAAVPQWAAGALALAAIALAWSLALTS